MKIRDGSVAPCAGNDARLRWTSRWLIAALALAAIPYVVRAQTVRDDCAERSDDAGLEQSHLVERRCAAPTAIELLSDIGGRLPNDTFLQRFALTNGEVQIQGMSADTSKLVQLLQRSEVIESLAVQGSVMPGASSGKEKFVISARVRELPKDRGVARSGATPTFLPEADFDAAAAGLSQRLSQEVSSKTDNPDRCQLIQRQYVRSAKQEPFERVTIKARLRCNWQSLAPILHELETMPALFIDEVQIWKQSGYRTPGTNVVEDFLDVQFAVYGYIGDHSAPQAPHSEPSARSTPPAGSRDPFDEADETGR